MTLRSLLFTPGTARGRCGAGSGGTGGSNAGPGHGDATWQFFADQVTMDVNHPGRAFQVDLGPSQFEWPSDLQKVSTLTCWFAPLSLP